MTELYCEESFVLGRFVYKIIVTIKPLDYEISTTKNRMLAFFYIGSV